MSGQRWDDDRADRLLDATRVILGAAGSRETPDDQGDDPAGMLRFAELYVASAGEPPTQVGRG